MHSVEETGGLGACSLMDGCGGVGAVAEPVRAPEGGWAGVVVAGRGPLLTGVLRPRQEAVGGKDGEDWSRGGGKSSG